MDRKFPTAAFKVDQFDLMHALSLPSSEAADLCGVGIATVERWKDGSEPLPYMAYQLLLFRVLGRIPAFLGAWEGWTLIDDRIYPPGATYKGAARQIEIMFIDHYRIDRNLCESQAEHIDGLTRRHDFYKRQCGLEAKFGLMLHNIFTPD